MKNQVIKVWITKYALSKGIYEIEVIQTDGDTIKTIEPVPTFFHGKNKLWYTTRESAITKAEEMRLKKVEILEKDIGKFKNMKFE